MCALLHNTIDGSGVCYSVKYDMATYIVTDTVTAVYVTHHWSLKGYV